jgi:hypothetical protein
LGLTLVKIQDRKIIPVGLEKNVCMKGESIKLQKIDATWSTQVRGLFVTTQGTGSWIANN